MSYSQAQFDEKTFVDRMLSNIHDLVCKTQPLADDDWFTRVERRNCIERICRDYEHAVALGFEWARIFNPSHFVPNWSEQLRFVQEIDSKRFSFIQFCDGILDWLNQIADAYQELEPTFSSRLRGAAKQIEEVRRNYTEPITKKKSKMS